MPILYMTSFALLLTFLKTPKFETFSSEAPENSVKILFYHFLLENSWTLIVAPEEQMKDADKTLSTNA